MAVLNKLICCACLSVVIIGAILMLFFYTILNPRCELLTEKPASDLNHLLLLKSGASNTLVKVAGYVKYNIDKQQKDSEKVYQPLLIFYVKVDHNESDNKKAVTTLSLRSQCVGVHMFYLASKETTTTTIKDILITLKRPNGEHKTCRIDDPKGLSFPKGYHYKCAETKQYDCYADDLPKDSKATPALVATLVFDSLEFEIEGDKKNFDEGKFSTPATKSCVD